MRSISHAPHHIDITQVVDPEGVQGSRDNVQLIQLKCLLTSQYRAVKPGADPPVHAAQMSGLKGKMLKRILKYMSPHLLNYSYFHFCSLSNVLF